jgi:hypothetical protein
VNRRHILVVAAQYFSQSAVPQRRAKLGLGAAIANRAIMEGLAGLTIVIYALAFFAVFGGLAIWWMKRPRKTSRPGEPPARYMDDSKDRIA